MIKGTDVRLSPEEQEAVVARLKKVVESNYYMWGDQQEEFQSRLATMTGRKHALTYCNVSTALEALFNVLEEKNWPERDPVVAFQGNQFPVDVYAAQRQAFEVTWVDIDLKSMCPDPEIMEAAYRKREFHVLVIQHTGGFVSGRIDQIRDWCSEHTVFLIEDAAQAMGSIALNRRAGSWGDVSVISFSATKFMTTGGQGGIILFDDDDLRDQLFQRKVYGRTEMFQKGEFVVAGWNGQMTELQAAVGNALLDTLDKNIDQRYEISAVYDSMLIGSMAMARLGNYSGRPNLYKYPVMLTGASGPSDRLKFTHWLKEHGVELSSGVYPNPTYRLQSLAEFANTRHPITDVFCANHVCLPMHNAMTVEDACIVVDRVKQYFKEER